MIVDIAELYKIFIEEYNQLYDLDKYVYGYCDAVELGNELIEKKSEIIRDFIKYRGDFLSSDREMAAFVFALGNMIINEKCKFENTEEYLDYCFCEAIFDRKDKVEKAEKHIINEIENILPTSPDVDIDMETYWYKINSYDDFIDVIASYPSVDRDECNSFPRIMYVQSGIPYKTQGYVGFLDEVMKESANIWRLLGYDMILIKNEKGKEIYGV